MSRKHDLFASIHTEGSLLPADFLKKISEGHKDVDGLEPEAFDLANERLNTAVARAWNRLQAAWASFQVARTNLMGEEAAATGLTREKWLLQVFMALDYGKLAQVRGLKVKDKDYAISHMWRHVPIHLVGFGVDLDRRQKGVAGAARLSPHGLVQDFLNQEDGSLWGIVSNGLRLRLMRDNLSLSRQAYVEFDLEAMFEGQLYADFHLFWTLCHQSRVNAGKPEDCWLERWSLAAREQGSRALDDLRDGVQKAIELLGSGYLQHPGNSALRQRLESGDLPLQDLNRQLLRLIYRLLFLFVAEDRHLLLDPQASAKAKERYREFYSTARLRRLASRMHGTRHGDLYQSLKLLMGFLHDQGAPDLGLPALNSFLWAPEAIADLLDAQISNRQLLLAIRKIAYVERQRSLVPVDFRNLGAEELGAVYEALLELRPTKEGREYLLVNLQGNERKSTGSYYTPTSLINLLLKSALDPVLERAAANADSKVAEQAILNLKICDPSCGSGHFLVAAGHRVARRLAMTRTGEDEPSPEAVRHALRDVVGHCLYGVDRNDLAVELCKVSLWLEGMEPGRPLSFLEHRVICGNSLIGATPALLLKGIRGEAFEALAGDDKKVVTALRRRNRAEQAGQTLLDFGTVALQELGSLTAQMQGLSDIDDNSLPAIHAKALRYQAYKASAPYQHAKAVADAWCFTFLGLKDDPTKEYLTQNTWLAMQKNTSVLGRALADEVAQTAKDFQFLHWHLEFPDVFKVAGDQASRTGWSGGFDVMIGNPPWERIKIQEKEWFAQNDSRIAVAGTASQRKKAIEDLQETNPGMLVAFKKSKRLAEGESHFLSSSDRYPLAGRGDINTYSIFTELFYELMGIHGRAGIVIPSGLLTDDTLKDMFRFFVENQLLESAFSFENEEFIFPGVANVVRFSLLTLSRSRDSNNQFSNFSFYLRKAEQANDSDRTILMGTEDFFLFNPNTRTSPIFRTIYDFELAKRIYQQNPVFVREEGGLNPWSVRFMSMFHMAMDSDMFSEKKWFETKGAINNRMTWSVKGREYLPLYEAKFVWLYDHRFGSYHNLGIEKGRGGRGLPPVKLSEHQDATFCVQPRYWVPSEKVEERLMASGWTHDWLLGWRDVTSAKLERTFVAAVIPRTAVGHKFQLMMPTGSAQQICSLLANLNSLPFDYVVRQKIGGTAMTHHIVKQLPVLPPDQYSEVDLEYVASRVLELTYTSDDLVGFAKELGYSGQPYCWNDDRRRLLMAELDVFYAKKYGLSEEELTYILDPAKIMGDSTAAETFRVLREREVEQLGGFKTSEAVLAAWAATDQPEATTNTVIFPAEPFERVSGGHSPYVDNVVPIYTLEAAATRYSHSQAVEEMDEMARVRARRRVTSGMFVARVKGRSMEPTIPDGSWCLFQYPPAGSRTGRVLLVQHRDISDPETGGSYTVKRWQSDKVDDGEGGWRHTEIRLMPDNPDKTTFKPIVLKPEDQDEVMVVADFVEVLV